MTLGHRQLSSSSSKALPAKVPSLSLASQATSEPWKLAASYIFLGQRHNEGSLQRVQSKIVLGFQRDPQRKVVWLSDGRTSGGIIWPLPVRVHSLKVVSGSFAPTQTHAPLPFMYMVWSGEQSKYLSLCDKHWGRRVPKPPS